MALGTAPAALVLVLPLQTGTPEAPDGTPFLFSGIAGLIRQGQRGASVHRQIATETQQRWSFLQNPGEFPARGLGDAVQDHGAPESDTRADAGYICARGVAQVRRQQCIDLRQVNAAGGRFVAVASFGKVRLATQLFAGKLDGLLKRQVLKRMQRVVVDKDADRPLRGQKVRHLLDGAREGTA